MRPRKHSNAPAIFDRLGSARTRELEQAGISRSELSRMVARGEIERTARGVYSLPNRSSDPGLTIVAKRVPRGVFCLLTALRLHGLTTQIPADIWLAISHKASAPKIDWPPVQLVRLTRMPSGRAVAVLDVDGLELRATSIARTVADCFKFRSRVGVDVALEALRDAHRSKVASIDELWREAKACRVANVMRPYLEGLT